MRRAAVLPRLWAPALAALACAATASCTTSALRVEGTGVLTSAPVSTPKPLPPEALRNIRNVDLRSAILTDQRVPPSLRKVLDKCATCGIDNPIYIDFTGDGIDDVLVPVYDEREQIGSVAFTVQDGRVRLAFAHRGRHTSLDVVEGGLQLSRPVFLSGDQACCPSGDPLLTTYSWNGRTFVLKNATTPGAARPDDTEVVIP